MKKSFTLFSLLVLILLFSILTIRIFENKSISSVNIINQYKYIQAKNHLKFLEEYIQNLSTLNNIDKIEIEDNNFIIQAFIKKVSIQKFEVELIVESLNANIKVHKILELIK